MCDEFFDDFEDDFDEEPDDGCPTPDADDVPWNGFQWQDWMIIGPLSEEIGREKREKERIRRREEIW